MARILVIDDETRIRELYRGELENEGHDVVTAASGLEALHIVRGTKIDLVIVDTRLKQEESLDLLRRLVEARPSLLIIATSINSTFRDDFASWLADDYLSREDGIPVLKEKVRNLLARDGK